jgi:GWxTD domain-containing protein
MYRHPVSYLLFFFTGFFFLIACTTQKVNQSSTDRLYKKDNNELDAEFYVYHINDSVSRLFYSFSNEPLVYKRTDTSTYFFSNVKLLVMTSPEENLSQVLDTAAILVRDRQLNVTVKPLKGSLYFKLRAGQKYHVDIRIEDLNKRTRYTNNVYSDKTSKDTRQNFLVTTTRGEVHFTPYYKAGEEVVILSERNGERLFNVDYFLEDFRLSPPPFSQEPLVRKTYKADSTFSVYGNGESLKLTLPQKGFYHLKTNEQTKEGVTFFVYEPSYPGIKNSEQMIQATRYIMAKREYENCMSAANQKEAIDKFWIDLGGSRERGTELIRKYYGRVQDANKLFTSYQEGWKTDRGMVYIVFGAPNRVNKRKNGEIWIYGEPGNPSSTVFSFIKVLNPFTDNDYNLERSETFKMPWYQAVDMWRQGRVYLDN